MHEIRHFLESRKWPAWIARVRPLARPSGLFIAFIGLTFVGVFLYNLVFPPSVPLSKNEIDGNIKDALDAMTPAPPYSTLVYQTILPSLVFIQTENEDAAENERFGVGSGVIINANGDILTAYHVVDDADEITVHYVDGTNTAAIILAAEPENDIAVLYTSQPPEIIVPAVMGNPNAMRVGDEAFAVGNPMGLVGSLSAGVISGFDRSIPVKDTDQRLEGLIQFDTAVNPGNSGGPLLNRRGQVVGIVTALANPSDQNFFVGIGFAVPIATAAGAAGGPGY